MHQFAEEKNRPINARLEVCVHSRICTHLQLKWATCNCKYLSNSYSYYCCHKDIHLRILMTINYSKCHQTHCWINTSCTKEYTTHQEFDWRNFSYPFCHTFTRQFSLFIHLIVDPKPVAHWAGVKKGLLLFCLLFLFFFFYFKPMRRSRSRNEWPDYYRLKKG